MLGIDAGERRVGVAISDPERRFALPLWSLLVDGRGGEMEALARLSRDEEVAEVVVGLPLSLSGEEGSQALRARAFGNALAARLALPVHFYDERLSTQQALRQAEHGRQRPAKRGERPRGGVSSQQTDVDAMAASIILQAYLDHERFARGERYEFDGSAV